MNMGMKDQVARPSVKYTDHPNLPAHEARVFRQLLRGFSRGLKQEVIKQFLILAGKVA